MKLGTHIYTPVLGYIPLQDSMATQEHWTNSNTSSLSQFYKKKAARKTKVDQCENTNNER
jgi:hypothetical protein